MQKMMILATLVATGLSFSNLATAEPVNCTCDCHKKLQADQGIEIGISPQKNNDIVIGADSVNTLNIRPKYAMSDLPATSDKTNVKTTQSSVQEQDKLYTGAVAETEKVHFGKSITDNQGESVVNRIGRKLLRASEINKSIFFTYSTEDTVNAYTELSGTVTVFRGILDTCEDEDELAFVIGHEIGHADGYHVAKSIAVDTGLSYGAKEASKVLNKNISSKLNKFGLESGTWSDIAVSKAQQLGSASYSKAHENDADLQAVDYMVKCGYNPLAGISILNKISVAYPDLFADHPSTDKRIVNIYNYVKDKYPQYLNSGYDTESYKEALKDYVL